MISPEAILAIAIAASATLSALATSALHRRRERRVAAQALRETEKRHGWVQFIGLEEIRKAMREEQGPIIARELRSIWQSVDKHLSELEVLLKSAFSYDKSDRENFRKAQDNWNAYERGQLEARVNHHQALQGLLEATRDLRDLCSRILVLFEPSK